jgi:hypothetical protein
MTKHKEDTKREGGTERMWNWKGMTKRGQMGNILAQNYCYVAFVQTPSISM